MADTEETIEDLEGSAEEEALEAGGQRKRLLGPNMVRALLYIAAALVLIIVSGTIAYMVAKRVGASPATDKTSPMQTSKTEPLSYFALESFSVNTSDTDEAHFLKLTLELGYEREGQASSEIQTELVQRRPEIRDIIISIIGAKSYSDLLTQENRDQLREEIQRKINSVLMDGEVKKVVFTEFVLT
jgi:flagellar FliL protein